MDWKISEPWSDLPESYWTRHPPSRVKVQYKSKGGTRLSHPCPTRFGIPLLQLLYGNKKEKKKSLLIINNPTFSLCSLLGTNWFDFIKQFLQFYFHLSKKRNWNGGYFLYKFERVLSRKKVSIDQQKGHVIIGTCSENGNDYYSLL